MSSCVMLKSFADRGRWSSFSGFSCANV